MIAKDVKLGEGVSIPHPDLVNLYGCEIGNRTKVGTFVEVQKGVKIGKNCKIQSHSFICEGVTIEDGVFVGHGVMFINDLFPQAVNPDGSMQCEGQWNLAKILVKSGVTIGSNATILGDTVIGEKAMIGAGAVVTKDVPSFAIVVGVPAKPVGDVRHRSRS